MERQEMGKSDLVSIIMPSYNCGRFIEASIRSVQAQTYREWELLVVDDCSADGSLQTALALQQEDPRIRVLRHEKRSGAATARNWALREARGRWIAFLDSDDQWESTKLERQIAFMEEHGYAFSYTNYQEMDEHLQPTGKLVTGPRRITTIGMYAFCWPGCLTVMYDAEKVGLVQIKPIHKNNDYALWLKVIRKADCYLLDECLARYTRGRSGSITTHGYCALIKWHYFLFRHAEEMSAPVSFLLMCGNLMFGVLKKLLYVRKVEGES
ncbi:MAG: glycosyltransferase family 2 protein [Prevotella sp.]|nr:glycosyltransferase family 2 protein [Prevotella sp.]